MSQPVPSQRRANTSVLARRVDIGRIVIAMNAVGKGKRLPFRDRLCAHTRVRERKPLHLL